MTYAESFNAPPQLPREEGEAVLQTPLILIRNALCNGDIALQGPPTGSEYMQEARELTASDSVFYAHSETERERLLMLTMRSASRFNHGFADSPFLDAQPRVQLLEEAADSFLQIKNAGFTGATALRLVLYNSADTLTSLRETYLTEHASIWSSGRIAKVMASCPRDPGKALALITEAFAHTRIHGNLSATNTSLHDAVSIQRLRTGDLMLHPSGNIELPPLPVDDPQKALDYIYASVEDGTAVKRRTVPSLVAYMSKVLAQKYDRSAVLQTYSPDDYKKFFGCVAWYMDKTNYVGADSDEFIVHLAESYAKNATAVEALHISQRTALIMACYHRASYYEDIILKGREYGLPSANFTGLFMKRYPIDTAGKLEELRPHYKKIAEHFPDMTDGSKMLLAINCLSSGYETAISDFEAAYAEAKILFGHLSLFTLHLACLAAPTSYLSRLQQHNAALSGGDEPVDMEAEEVE